MPAVPALRAPEAGGRLVRCSAHRGGARHPHARHAQGGRFRARVRRWALRGSGGRQLAERGRGTSSADLDAAQAADARWLRVDINWTQIQADGPAAYDCDHVDASDHRARARGLSVLGTIVYTPVWARPRHGGDVCTSSRDPSSTVRSAPGHAIV